MASSIQLLRSTQVRERPFPGNLLEGQPAVNINPIEPGVFFKASDGSLVKIGPVAITYDGSPPNSSPIGAPGNSIGEMWFDLSQSPGVLKIYDGSTWLEAGSGGGGGGGGSAQYVRWSYTSPNGGETSLSGVSNGVLLQYTPGLEDVFLNGVLLSRGEEYFASNGSSITGMDPLVSGDIVTVISNIPVEVIELPGQVTLARWDIISTAGQTILTGQDSSGADLSYEPGFEQVYVNGAHLRRGADYLASDGVSVSLSVALNDGDEVSILCWSPFSIGSISGNSIVDGTISGSKLEPLAVGSTQLDDDAVTTAKVAPGAIDTDQLADGSVTPAKLSSSVTTPDATAVQYEYVDTADAEPRSVADRLYEVTSVLDYIPESEHAAIRSGTSSYDCLPAFSNALSFSNYVIVPPGRFVVSGTINIGGGRTLKLSAGTTIYKETGTIEPVVRIFSNNASLIGAGWASSIISTPDVTGYPSDPTREGIVNIGPRQLNQACNINWSRVDGITVSGSSQRYSAWSSSGGTDTSIDSDIGIKMVNAANFSNVSGSLYNTTVTNVKFQLVGIGLDLEPVVQGNHFSFLYFYRCSLYGIFAKGCNENAYSHTFFHSAPGIQMVRMRRAFSAAEAAAAPYFFSFYRWADRGCSENSFIAFNGEPGPTGPGNRYTRYVNFDDSVGGNFVQGQENTGHTRIDNSASGSSIISGSISSKNTISASGFSSSGGITSTAGNISFGSSNTADAASLFGHKLGTLGNWNLTAGDKIDVGEIILQNTQTAAEIEFLAIHGWPPSSSSQWGTSRLRLSVYRGNSAAASYRVISVEKTASTGFVEPTVSGDTITVGFYTLTDSLPLIMYRVIGGRQSTPLNSIVVNGLDGSSTNTQPILPTGNSSGLDFLPTYNNSRSLGSASYLWTEVFAANNTINTSDARLKTDIRSISDSEAAVAKKLKGLIKAFKFKDSVESKGDAARIHFGAIAQEVEEAFASEGLSADEYGLFCRDTWYELDGGVIELDEDGTVPPSAKEVSRLGIRYEQLLAFIISSI